MQNTCVNSRKFSRQVTEVGAWSKENKHHRRQVLLFMQVPLLYRIILVILLYINSSTNSY